MRGRAIEIHRFSRASDVNACHLLFVTTAQAKNVAETLRRLRDLPPLTVGESEDFIRSGGAIRFFIEENKVRFEVNTDAAGRAKVKLSSKLLSLARIVRDAAPSED